MKQAARNPNFYKEKPTKRKFNIGGLLLIIIVAAVSGGIVNFIDNLHYSNFIQQSQNQASATRSALTKEQYDIRLLINSNREQFNCYDLETNYARSICSSHNANIPS